MSIIEKYSLENKVIVVTGGTGILGNAFIDAIVEAGGTVGILGRKKEVAEERANAINAKGGKAIALVADVLDEAQLQACKQQVLDAFGKIDGLVNNAGVNDSIGLESGNHKAFMDSIQKNLTH